MAKSVSWGGKPLDPLLLILLGPFALGVAAALAVQMPPNPNPDASLKCWLFAGAVVPFILGRGVWIWRTQRELTATDTGFVYASRKGKLEFSDADITDLGIEQDFLNADAGVLAIRTVRLAFRSNGRAEEVLKFEQRAASVEHDVFGRALERALEKLVERAVEGVKAGEPILGAGWELVAGELKLGDKLVVPLSDITRMEVRNNTLRVWAAGQTEPVLRRNLASRGVTVLHGVLKELRVSTQRPVAEPVAPNRTFPVAEAAFEADDVPEAEAVPVAEAVAEPEAARTPRIVGRPRRTDDVVDAEEEKLGNGKLLFSRTAKDTDTFNNAFAIVFCAAALLGGVAMIVFGLLEGFATKNGKLLLVAGVVATLIGGVASVDQWIRSQVLFQCFANAVVYRTWRGTICLRYRDIGSFTYSGTRMIVNGIYHETKVQFVFEHFNREGFASIDYQTSYHEADTQLDDLRNHISAAIAKHMMKRLTTGQSVRWTSQLGFEPGYLVEGRAEKQRLPLNELGPHEFDRGVFYLYPTAGLTITSKVSERNFFPGYFLFLLLTKSEPQLHESKSSRRDSPRYTPRGESRVEPDSPFEGLK